MTTADTTGARISVEVVDDGSGLRMVIAGGLDADAAPVVAGEFDRLIEGGVLDFVIDLGAITMISSAGVGSLIAGIGQVRDEGGAVRVVKMSDIAEHVLEMLDLVDYFSNPA